MTKIFSLNFLLLLLLFFAQQINAQTLVASYPFSGNANDVSGFNNNGTVTGAVLTTDRFGNANSAYTFAGGTNTISAPDQTWLNLTNNFTVTGWIYPTATPPTINSGTVFTIASKDIGAGNNNRKWIFGLQNGALAFHINGPGLGSGEWTVSNTFSLQLNQWYYCVVTKNGNTVNYYINGTNIGSATYVGTLLDPAGAPLTIGYSEPGLTTTGKLDDIKLYNSVLTANQIANNYLAETLSASYPFNSNANDVSGNGNNGVVNGATLTADRFGNANSAYSFNGSSSYIDIANSASLQLSNSYTLSAWVKPNAFYSGFCQANFILAKGNQASEGHYNLQYGDFLDFSCGAFTPTNENFASTIKKGGADQSVYENPSTQPVALNNWYYVVCTYDGTTQKLFVNGKLRASNTTSGSFGVLNTENLFIGKSNDASGYFVNGVIDEVNIYSNPLTDAQIFDIYVNDLKLPGSGNSLQFVRTNDVNTCPSLNIGSGYSFGSQPFTFETWVKKDEVINVPTNLGRIMIVSESNNGWAAGLLNDGQLFLSDVGISGQGSGVVCIDPNDLNWHHVAISYAANNVSFYVDGIFKSTVPYAVNFNGSGDYSLAFRQSFKPYTEQNLSGRMDEVRIWKNVALSQTEIRDWMCKKITSAHPQYQNLFGYFKNDEGANTLTRGYNSRYGNFVNGTSINWQASGAAIGDASAHDYVNAIKSTNISHQTGENFAVTSTSGNPSGIQVYRVDEQPNTLLGASGVGSNNKYFGVFQIGGTTPEYTAVYNYNGNPNVTVANENQLRLNKRTDNSSTSWTVMPDVPDESNNNITVTGQSTEYILGKLGAPLPIVSIVLKAIKNNNSVDLKWTVVDESNIKLYEVQKSTSNNSFTKIKEQASSSLQAYNYTVVDDNPAIGANYYRLKIVAKDGTVKYSEIVVVNFGKQEGLTIKPNPVHQQFSVIGNIAYDKIEIIDITGKANFSTAKTATNNYSIPILAKGMYIIQFIKNNSIVSKQKIIVD